MRKFLWILVCVGALALMPGGVIVPSHSHAAGKVYVYGTSMEPTDRDAERFSRSSWGGGIGAVFPAPAVHNLAALSTGLELTNMMSQSTMVYDPVIRLQLEQRTNQTYGRFYLGGLIGPHGPAFFRPHVGANVALVWYGISTDIDIPNPSSSDPDAVITRNLESNFKGAFGYDLNAGLDLNIANKFPIELGMRHVQSFNIPQPLGAGSVTVSPTYFQIYFGIGVSLEVLMNKNPKSGSHDEQEEED